MITYYTDNFNNKIQNLYDNINSELNVFSLKCLCGLKGQIIRYGFYYRSIRTSIGIVELRVQRVFCKSCGHTHAILLSSMIPYSQFSLNDMLSIIRSVSFEDLDKLMIENPYIDESNIAYIKKQFDRHWKQRLLSECIALDESLVFQCFLHYGRQFMQIKCTRNILFTPTNIT